MFSKFITRGGRALLIRSIDMRSLEDGEPGGAVLVWEPTPGQLMDRTIKGTADENMARLRQEESAMLIASEKLRQRQANGMPSMPVIRGRK
jgi:hypothetical protein